MIKRGWNGLKKAISPKTITPEKYVQKEAFNFLPTPTANITQDVSLQMASLRPSNVGSAPTFVKGGSLEIASLTPSNVGSTSSFVMGGIENAETRAVGKLKTNVIESAIADTPLAELGTYSSNNVPVKINNPKISLNEASKTDTVINSIKENGIPASNPSEVKLLPTGSNTTATMASINEGRFFTSEFDKLPSNFNTSTDYMAPVTSSFTNPLTNPIHNPGAFVTEQQMLKAKLEAKHYAGKTTDEIRYDKYMRKNAQYGGSNTERATLEKQNAETPWSSTARAVLGTAVVGAGICAALSSSRGQQNNAQLYGQQPLY